MLNSHPLVTFYPFQMHSVELGIILNAHCIRILDTYNSIRVLVDRFTELQLAAHCCQLHYAIRQFFSPTPL